MTSRRYRAIAFALLACSSAAFAGPASFYQKLTSAQDAPAARVASAR